MLTMIEVEKDGASVKEVAADRHFKLSVVMTESEMRELRQWLVWSHGGIPTKILNILDEAIKQL